MVKKTMLSAAQDLAASPTENVWVQANAGTGKTSVLTQRLLRILFRVSDCTTSGILCLTYTNAGAGEMRNRILTSLRRWALATDAELIELLAGVSVNTKICAADIAHAREIFFKYIDNPDMLKIKTIHGFCEEILHRFPIEAGVSPSWQLVSDDTQRILLQDTFTKLVNSSPTDSNVAGAFFHIVSRVSETYMSDLLGVLSNQYKSFFQVNDYSKYRKYFIDTISKYLNLDCGKPVGADVALLKKIIDLASDEQKNAKKPVKYLDEIINLTKQYVEKTIDFEKYKKAYLTDKGTKKATVAKKDFLVAEQQRVFALNEYNSNKAVYDDTVALFDLSLAFASKYKREKQLRNLLDFDDLILYTRKLFSNSASMGWVLSQMDVSLTHILVDEAQDTSPIQWDILRMLSGDFFAESCSDDLPNSLFVVGDTKQSIYGFQGADPGAFAASRHAISAQISNNMRTIREVPLAQSFRSARSVLEAVDKFFADDTVIQISGFNNNPHKCFRSNVCGALEIHRLVSKQDSGTSIKQYVTDIACRIKQIIDSGRYAADDIMVLVQQRNPMVSPLVYQLKHLGVNVAGSDRIVLPEYPAIRDLLNLVRWCLNPIDDYSLCCVLKSPIFYLNEQNIYELCNHKNLANKHLERRAPDASPITVYEILGKTNPSIYDRLTQIKQWADTLSPYSFFCSVLNTDGTRSRFISALGSQVIEPLEEFITICLAYERTQPGTLRQFLKWFIVGGSQIKRDMNASDGVRIATVHGSKGLEAPVVFLIDTVRTPKTEKILPLSSKSDMPVWLWQVAPNISSECAGAMETLSQARIAEYYRLLYVAMTRARDELYIYGYTPHKNAPYDAWHTQLWRVLAQDTDQKCFRNTNDDLA